METGTLKTLATPIAVLLAGVAIAGAVLWNGQHTSTSQSAPTPQQQTQAQAAPQKTADISKVNITGEPFLGNVNAPVTVAYWFDYQCPFCKQNEETVTPQLIKDYVDTGKVKIVFKDFQFLGEDSQRVGQFARAVWAIAPDKFYLWHKAMYDNAGTENTGWATQDKILSITKGVLGASDTNKALQLVQANSASYQKEMDADKAEGSAFGVTGTPSFIIGKQLIIGAVPYAQLKTAIDATLK